MAANIADQMPGTIFILNGPNLNQLGTREPEIYGHDTLDDIQAACESRADELGYKVSFQQSNHEGELVSAVQKAGASGVGLILNAAGYTHTSIALMDALKGCDIPSVEVHLSNIFRRENFRHHSYISPAVTGMICGFGAQGYILALDALARQLQA